MSERDLDDLLVGLRDAANPIDVLAEAELRVLDRLDTTMADRPQALGVAFRAARRTVLALVAVGGVAVGAATTAAISFAIPSDPDHAIEFAAPPANPTTVAFSAVERSTQKPDAGYRASFRALAREEAPDIRFADARRIRAADGTQAWVIPGSTRTCFGTENDGGSGFTCTSNAHASRGGLSTASVDKHDVVSAVYLVPDSVTTARAAGRTFTPHNNLIVMSYPAGTTVTFTMESGDTFSRHR